MFSIHFVKADYFQQPPAAVRARALPSAAVTHLQVCRCIFHTRGYIIRTFTRAPLVRFHFLILELCAAAAQAAWMVIKHGGNIIGHSA